VKSTIYNNIQPFDWRGLQIRELTPEKLASISIAEIEIAPGKTHPVTRSTKSDKVYMCIDGSVSFQVNDNIINLKPRDLLLIQKGEWFRYENKTEFLGRLVLIHIPPFDLDCEEFKDD
jgi:mannose-6-phosphate isomerase-like protein (cupin superfamily)